MLEIYKEATHMIVEAGKPKFYNVSQDAGDPGEPMIRMKPTGNLLENSVLLRKAHLFVLSRPLTDWMRPTILMRAISFT